MNTCAYGTKLRHVVGIAGSLALGLPSVLMVMTGATPLGLQPSAVPGCNAAAARRLGLGMGGANAVPPPHVHPCGWAARLLGITTALCSIPHRDFSGHILQEVDLSPLWRPLTAIALERRQRGCAVLLQCVRHHHT